MENRSFLKSGSKEIVLHGGLLRYKNEDEIKDIVVEKIDSISSRLLTWYVSATLISFAIAKL